MKKFIQHLLHKIPSSRFFAVLSRKINKTNLGMIVTLHSVTDEKTASAPDSPNQFIEISSENFEKVLNDLQKLDVEFISLARLEQCLAQPVKPARPIVHLSFDDGYENNYSNAFPILKKYQIPFSIFVVSDFMNSPSPFLWWYLVDHILTNKIPVSFEDYGFSITEEMYAQRTVTELFPEIRDFLLATIDQDRAYFEKKLSGYARGSENVPAIMSWEQLNEMAASGLCEVGVHTKSHARFSMLTDHENLQEIMVCKEEIEKHTGIESRYFAYSYGGARDIGQGNNIPLIMKKAGIHLGLTTIIGELKQDCNPYLLPRVFLNNAATPYTLKTRLSGSYQRESLDD